MPSSLDWCKNFVWVDAIPDIIQGNHKLDLVFSSSTDQLLRSKMEPGLRVTDFGRVMGQCVRPGV